MMVSDPGFSSLNNPDLNDLIYIYSLYILNVLISLRSEFDIIYIRLAAEVL